MKSTPPNERIALDLGHQPVSNFFPEFEAERVDRYPLQVVWEPSIGVAKIERPFPREAIRPVHPWLSYREPEDHLDEVAEQIHSRFQDQAGRGVAIALSYKDETLLQRLEKKGIPSDRIDPKVDLQIQEDTFGLESIDKAISEGALSRPFSKPAVFLVRHILEHTVSPQVFLEGIKNSMKQGDLVFIETPECTEAIKRCDYTLIWEEHNFYYTESSLQREIERAGFEIVWQKTHKYPMEGSALFVARKPSRVSGYTSTDLSENEDALDFRAYAETFQSTKRSWAKALKSTTRPNSRISLFGAGHFACAFVHYLGAESFVTQCIDDREEKQGRYLPGTKLPILPSSALLQEETTEICLLTVNPDSEAKILEKLAPFLKQGGKAFSIFPNSPRYLLK